MKFLRFFLPLVLAFSLTQAAEAKKRNKNGEPEIVTIYGFGVAQDLADSTVYMTAISTINGATMLPHELLDNHIYYTQQLRDYLANALNLTHQSVAFFFARSQKQIDKKYARVLKKMEKHPVKRMGFKAISDADFHFKVPVIVQAD